MSGRKYRNQKLKDALTDQKVASHLKGWLTQEINDKYRKGRTYIRNPRGYQLAHKRGFEAAKGFSYKYSDFQTIDLHKLQHKYDEQGRLNKTPTWFLQKKAIENQTREKYRTDNNIQFSRYQSVPKPGGVKLVIGEVAPTLFGSRQVVSRVNIKGSTIVVNFQNGALASYVTSLLPEELADLRRGVLCYRKGVSISLEMGDGKYNCLLDGLSSDSPLRANLFKADQVLGGLTFGMDYFTGEKFVTKMPGYRNHFDVRTEMLSNSADLGRLGYDKFSTILPHPTFEINPTFKLTIQGNRIGFEGQELHITSRGVYVDWMGEVYYDDRFETGIQMFPILQNFSSSYDLYKQYHPEIAKVAEYVRAVLLLSLDGKAGSSSEFIYFCETKTGGVSLTRSVHPSVLSHTVALIQAQESLLAKASDPLFGANIAYFLATSWEATELNIDTSILLYIYALENLPDAHSNVPYIFARLGNIFKKYSNVISKESYQLVVNRIIEVHDGDIPLHEKLNGIAYEIAFEDCEDFLLSNLYFDALPDDFSNDKILSAWCNTLQDASFIHSLPMSAIRPLGNWKKDPLNGQAIEKLLPMLKKKDGSTRYPLLVSLLLYVKSVHLYEQRVDSVQNGVSASMIESMSCLGECVDTLKSTPGGAEFIPLAFHRLGLAHMVMALDKELLLAEHDLKASKSALSKRQFQEALYKAHSAKSYGESVLSVLPADGHLACQRACKTLSDIYRSMGNRPYANEWRLLADKERMDFQRLRPGTRVVDTVVSFFSRLFN